MNRKSPSSTLECSRHCIEVIRDLTFACAFAALISGCATSSPARTAAPTESPNQSHADSNEPDVKLVSHWQEEAEEVLEPLPPRRFASVEDFEAAALASNPALRRLAQDYEAARAKTAYVDKLPDPTIGTNIFAHPIETAAGSQRANITISQMLPWLPRLSAQAQQACFEAIALSQLYAAERLRVIAQIRTLWYRLYVIQKQIDINNANQELLKSLIDVANSRVATGRASQGDILIATLEFSKLEETLVSLDQQLTSSKSEINRLAGLPAESPVDCPQQLHIRLPNWKHATLRDLAWSNQPDIESARVQTQATRWGIEIARRKRRPDFTVNASWFAIDDNRPNSAIVDIGEDAWSVGAMMSVPLGHRKYEAMEQEARWKHAASHSSVEQTMQHYDALLLDLMAQARAADETARLYQQTIIPEARRTLNADQASYTNGQVDFDRLIQDVRSLLTLEIGYHRSMGRLATAIARIEQAIGTELSDKDLNPLEDGSNEQHGDFSADEPIRPPEPGDH